MNVSVLAMNNAPNKMAFALQDSYNFPISYVKQKDAKTLRWEDKV